MTLRAITVAMLAALIVACAAPPRPRPSSFPPPRDRSAPPADDTAPQPAVPPYTYREDLDHPRGPEQVSGPAVLALLEQAQQSLQTSQYDQAIATLETALDIEPRNPFIWQRIALVHLRQHLPEQAETKAQRSNSFARGNPYVELENWRLIAAARQARGDVPGAEEASLRVEAIQAALAD